MEFVISEGRPLVDTKPKWWSQELEEALLDTEGTVNTLKLTIPREDFGTMVAKVRTYLYDHYKKPLRAKWCKDGLRLWVPTEDEIKMARKKVRSEKGKVYGFKNGGM
jgi:hypothetical protein